MNIDLNGYRSRKTQRVNHMAENTENKQEKKNKKILMSRAIVWYEMKKFPDALKDYGEIIKIDSYLGVAELRIWK